MNNGEKILRRKLKIQHQIIEVLENNNNKKGEITQKNYSRKFPKTEEFQLQELITSPPQ